MDANVNSSSGEQEDKNCKELIRETTAHGCRNVMSKHRSRFLWLCCVIGMGAGLIAVLYIMLHNYWTFPFNTVIKIGPKTHMEFPKITLCDLTYLQTNNFPSPQAVKDVFLSYSPMGFISAINKSNSDFIAIENLPLDKAHEFSNITVNSLFLVCSWRGRVEPCEQMWSSIFTDMGKCFVFNSNSSSNYIVNSSGSKGGIHFFARIRQEGYIVSGRSNAGLKLRLHDPHEDSRIYDSGIYVSPGKSSLISVRKKSFKFLTKPYKAYGDEYCVENSSLQNSSAKYDREVCIRNCLVQVVNKNCSCKSVTEPDTLDYPMCTIAQWLRCYVPTLDRLYSHNIRTYGCDCPRVCEFNHYDTKLSVGMFPSVPAIDVLKNNNIIHDVSEARMGYLDVTIFFEDLLLEEVVHVPVYTYTTIMGTVGGQMGLFLGASIITVGELLEIFVIFIWSKMKKIFCSLKSEQKNQIKVAPKST